MRSWLIRCTLLVTAAVAATDCGGGDVTDQLLTGGVLDAASAVGTPGGGRLSTGVASSESSDMSGPSSTGSQPSISKSRKRGVAYDLAAPADFQALSAGVSWWYNWSPHPSPRAPAVASAQYQMDFYPMIWGISYDVSAIEDYLRAHRQIHYLLVLNEPNLTDQADLTPQLAASLWPDFEEIAAKTGVELVGPAVTWGTMAGYKDPVAWLDGFYAAYEAANHSRPPRIDYIAFHWYDYGLAYQLDRLKKYGKPFWVTEVANWHARPDGAQIDTLAKQEAQMAEMVATCESRADVFRYAWFTGRARDGVRGSSLLAATGKLTELGQLYVTLPYASQ
jgi:hypothetical protein